MKTTASCVLRATRLAALTALLGGASAHAASYTWDAGGAPSTAWSTSANWVGNPSPAPTFTAGDTFDLSKVDLTANDISTVDSNQTLGVILIGDSTGHSHSWTLDSTGGSVLTLDNGASAAQITAVSHGTANTISVPLELKGNLNITTQTTQTTRALTLAGPIASSAASGTQTITVNSVGGSRTIFDGAISNGTSGGTVALAISPTSATAETFIRTDNTFTGGVTLNSGILQTTSGGTGLTDCFALGPAGSTFTIAGNATWDTIFSKRYYFGTFNIFGNVTSSNNMGLIHLKGAISVNLGNGTRTLTGTGTGGGNLPILFDDAGQTVNDGTLRVAGGSGSSPTNPMFLLFNSASQNVVFNNANLQFGPNATIRYFKHNPFGTNPSALPGVTVETNGALNLSTGAIVGLTESRDMTIAWLAGTGNVVNSAGVAGTATLTINGSSNATLDGAIQDGGYNSTTLGKIALVKEGSGTQTLAGTNTYTGATTVNAGTLLINGSTAAASTVAVGASGTLGGTGTIGGATSVAGTLSPGNSTGILTIDNDVTITNGGALAIEINGTTVGADYDRLAITGTSPTFSLTDTNNLVLTLGYTPSVGHLFFIASVSGTNAISGVFEELNGVATTLDQDSIFSFGGYSWQISYTGDVASNTFSGAGNDLALQVIPEPATGLLGLLGLGALAALRRRR